MNSPDLSVSMDARTTAGEGICIIYSSRTGNTRKVASHLAETFGAPSLSVQEAVRRWGVHAAGRGLEAELAELKEHGGAHALGCGDGATQGLCGRNSVGHAARDRSEAPQVCGIPSSACHAPGIRLPETRLLVLGFWMWRGGPDGAMLGLMRRLRGRDVFVFATMAACPDSEHAQRALARTQSLLESGGNRLMGHFFCQGRLDPAVLARSRHPVTPERLRRLEEAAKHPDSADLIRAEAALRLVLEG